MSEFKKQYLPVAFASAQKYNLDPVMFAAQIEQESGWNPNAKSSAGARGLGQFMPGTAKQLGVNPLDPVAALDASAKYMRYLTDKFGSEDVARQAYNAGEGKVARVLAGKAKFADETINYNPLIAKRAQALGKELGIQPGGGTVVAAAKDVVAPSPMRAAGEPAPKRVSSTDAAAIAMQEINAGLPAGALMQQMAAAEQEQEQEQLLEQPQTVAQMQQPDWRSSLATMQQPVVAAANPNMVDLNMFDEVQDVAAKDQDRVLAAMLGDGGPAPEDTRRLPTSVDRYLDKLLS